MPTTPKTGTGRARRVLLRLAVGALVLIALVTTVGTLTTTHVVTVTRTTTASADAIWNLWADVPHRTRWDTDLEWARIDGLFQHGATGEVKLADQPVRAFEVIGYKPTNGYTDRFFLPLGTHMDWHHTITELGNGRREVSFRVEVTGPTALLVALIAGNILSDDLPATVERLTTLAERAPAFEADGRVRPTTARLVGMGRSPASRHRGVSRTAVSDVLAETSARVAS